MRYFFWFFCAVCIAIPPLGVIAVIMFLMFRSCRVGNGEKIHYSKINYPPCRAFGREIDKDGMTWAKSYRDRAGRMKYCSNPNHNHFY